MPLEGMDADRLHVTVRHPAPLSDNGARVRYDLCEVDGGPGAGHGVAWRFVPA